jgi:DNA-binding beta-propeller fold protein YncE
MSAHTFIATLAPALLAMTGSSGFKLEYRYNLATVAGEVHTSAASLSFDPQSQELYVVGHGQVRVFNASGMEVFRFGDDAALGSIYGVAALEDGDLLVISYRDSRPGLLRLNFRGEIIESVELTGVPEAFKDLGPNAIAYRNGRVYLADLMGMRVLLVDPAGKYLASYDLAEIIDVADKRSDHGLNGFGVDRDGSMLFTVAPLFRGFVVSLAGQVRSFGRPGSAPGSFGIVAGIGSDPAGRYYVVDTLKCAVLVFDSSLKFLGEFGSRGKRPGQLVGPTSVAVADNRIFVSQQGNRGITVYQVRDQ